MLQKTFDVKSKIVLLILTLVNALFFVKYLERVTEYYLLIGILLSFILLSIWALSSYIDKYARYLKYINVLLIMLLVVGSFYIFKKVPIEAVNVDRWEIITAIWKTFEKGEYAYGLQLDTGNRPGAMPFYFLLAYPFYVLGEFGLMPIVALFVFILTLKYAKIKITALSVCLWFLIVSPTFLWEIVTRSTLYLNSVLVLFSVVYFLTKDKSKTKYLIISGILFGLFLSIRFVFVLAYVVMALYAIRTKQISIKGIFIVAISTILSFALTFLPFVWGHFEEFLEMNPFIVQSTFLVPFYYTVLFFIMAIVFSFLCKRKNDVYLYSSIVLFISILVYFLYFVCTKGFEPTFFGHLADISYFIFCIPFALFYVAKRLNEK